MRRSAVVVDLNEFIVGATRPTDTKLADNQTRSCGRCRQFKIIGFLSLASIATKRNWAAFTAQIVSNRHSRRQI